MTSQRIVFSTFGSFGDLHPYLALALEMKARGHHCTLATSRLYETKIRAAGLEFAPVRPNLPDPRTDPETAMPLLRRLMDERHGTERLFKELLAPALRDSYEDLARAAEGADLLVTHALPLSGPLVAQKSGVKWASGVLAPLSFFSAFDPCVPPIPTPLAALRRLPPRALQPIIAMGKRSVLSWVSNVAPLRRELGLPRGEHPLFEGQHSPDLVLAMFSPLLGAPQRDWPPHSRAVGFCFYDKKDEAAPDPRLQQFLDAGDAPIVFTLGTSAVFDPGAFFEASARAAQQLGRRAVLLVGRDAAAPPDLPASVLALDYAPFGELFPRACAIVHQGGAGTTGQVMRAGVPSLVMPYAHDQPDHAVRLHRLGIARTIRRDAYTPETAARALQALIADPDYARHARKVGLQVQQEHGPQLAADSLEELLAA